MARSAGVPFLLDACQSAGQIPLDVVDIGCDFLAATGRKFLRGPRGTGFLYVRDEFCERLRPAVVEVGGAAWTARDGYTLKPGAGRFETWEVSYASQLGLGRAIDYALDIGMRAIADRVMSLASSLRVQLSEIPGVKVHDLGARKCGIVTFSVAGIAARSIKTSLFTRGVNVDCSTAEDTRLDFERRGLTGLVRASVHYFNTEEEIEIFCREITAIANRKQRKLEPRS